MAYKTFEEAYRSFLKNLVGLINENEEKDGRNQKKLIKDLLKTESKFRTTLYTSPAGYSLYRKFGEFITEEEGNILRAKPFFRERQNTFTKEISPLLDKKDYYKLRKFKINYKFAEWAVCNYEGPRKNHKELQKLCEKIINIRNTLCENNIPLAIHYANRFWSKIKYSKMEHMEVVQTASEGLLYAIDKYVPENKKEGFKHVAIGRMSLSTSTEHNQTSVSMPPTDRRILYRANLGRSRGLSGQELISFVKESFSDVDESKVVDLTEAAIGIKSLDEPINETDKSLLKDIIPSNSNMEEEILHKDMIETLYKHIDDLDIIEKKIIRMKFGI